ncbi:GNAT family N-acetyltransferase [Candidatus Poribacteria bacterium]|nr:GNAT family N-acetyltransferase [Candidatus Poribacteria bacterium]
MNASNLIEELRPWLDEKIGAKLDLLGSEPIPVVKTEEGASSPLFAARVGERGLVTTERKWLEQLKPIVANLSLDELFSTFGGYELARVLLPDGCGVWGPSWFYVGDENCFRDAGDDRPVQLSAEELAETVDHRIFWHCFEDEAMTGFGIFEDGKLVSLAAVQAEDDRVWEIGVDTAPEAKGRGLGRAVVSAAGRWILENNRFVFASTAPWNVRSARTLRSVGLQFIMSVMIGTPGPFYAAPQPLGTPYPGAEVYNYYPDWAINKEIKPPLRD